MAEGATARPRARAASAPTPSSGRSPWAQTAASRAASGALASLQDLNLGTNQIGDDGLKALAEACASGALASLKELYLYENQIGDAGISALADAVSSGALDKLTVCWRPTALSSCLGTWHVHSSDSYLLFDVQYAVSSAQ